MWGVQPTTRVLLITAGKLDWQMQKSRWFTALDEGVTVPAAAVELRRQLPGWIEKRFQTRNRNLPGGRGAVVRAESKAIFWRPPRKSTNWL